MPNAKRALVIVMGSLIAACFSATKPLDSTQTGNPPVIDTERVALRVTSSDVRVSGEPGAVEPGGAKVEVKNLTTGMSFTTEAAADGSFDLEVMGSENDAYSVRAKSGGRTSSPVFVIRGTAAVGDGRDGTLSCEQRNTLAGELLMQAAESADRSCMVDADCAPVVARASCYAPGCWYAYVSQLGQSQIERVGRDIDSNLCAEYAADDCSHPLPKCMQPAAAVCLMGECGSSAPAQPEEPPPSCNSLALKAGARFDTAFHAANRSCMVDSDCVRAPVRLSCREDCALTEGFSQAGAAEIEAAVSEIEAAECSEFKALGCSARAPICDSSALQIACVENVCTSRMPPNVIPDCVVCLEDTVQWTWHPGPGIEDGGRVEPCATYMRHRSNAMTGEEVSCETELVACNAFTSTGAISTALYHRDVRDALMSSQNPVSFGNTRSGDIFTIMIGMHQLELGGSCEGAPPNCIPVPEGVQELRDLLQQIDQAFSGPMGPCASFGGN
jgi:hypothetical protein